MHWRNRNQRTDVLSQKITRPGGRNFWQLVLHLSSVKGFKAPKRALSVWYNILRLVACAPQFSSMMRFWKSETIRGRPCFSETLGSQLRRDLALEMSGFLMCGSSAVLGLNSTDAPGSIVSFTTCSKKNAVSWFLVGILETGSRGILKEEWMANLSVKVRPVQAPAL